MIAILLLSGIFIFNYYFPSEKNREIIRKYKDELKKREDFEYSYGGCFFSSGKYFDPYIKDSKWKGDKVYFIEIIYPSNCGYDYLFADYKIDDEKLLLKNTPVGNFMSCGYCRSKLKYTIRNIEKKDYEIIIENPNSMYNFSTKQWTDK